MKPKAIFLDIDGTLTEPGTNVPPASALEAIRRAQEAGNYVFLCTGRNYAMLSPLLKYGFDGVVASAGGYVVCRDEVIYDSPMTDEERDRMIMVLRLPFTRALTLAVPGSLRSGILQLHQRSFYYWISLS